MFFFTDCGVMLFFLLYSSWIARLRFVSEMARVMESVMVSA